MKRFFLLACATLLASGCAGQSASRYPSLLPRPIESRGDAEPAPTPVAMVATEPALDQRLAESRATLAESAAAFVPAARRAEQEAIAAKGSAAGSERWITAQSALAELDGYRATTSSALTDLEAIAIARAADGQPDYPAIETVRAAAEAQLGDQSARIAAIQAMLPAA